MIPEDMVWKDVMREVPVPTGFAAYSRRPIVLVMAWLFFPQPFVAGFSTPPAATGLRVQPALAHCPQQSQRRQCGSRERAGRRAVRGGAELSAWWGGHRHHGAARSRPQRDDRD